MSERDDTARLLVSCPDRHGIVATDLDAALRAGREHRRVRPVLDRPRGRHVLPAHGVPPRAGSSARRAELEAAFAEIARALRHGAGGSPTRASAKRIALLASRDDHCLLDLLWRWRRGELEGDIVAVVSNHPDHERDVDRLRRPVPPRPGGAGRQAGGRGADARAARGQVDLVVLARYMQILSAEFLGALAVPVINIHHSFLPAFVGAKPYERARERGVKIIGATAHYVTEELDAGPIIEQDVARVSHRQSVAELERIGRDIERIVLARAVSWHLEDRVLVHENRTVVF